MSVTTERTAMTTERLTLTTAAGPDISAASALRRLYFVRFAFAIVWALVMFTTAKHLGPLAPTLFVVYPRSTWPPPSPTPAPRAPLAAPILLYVNIAISMIAAIGLVFAGASGIPAVLRVWGSWAVVAGLIQLTVALTRRAMGGQWPMIISGAISVLAGIVFIANAGVHNPTLTNAIGYAIPGAIFFLISAIRLGRSAKGN